MNIMLNFIPLKKGGGVQVGLDFLSSLNGAGDKHNWYLVCTEGTPFQQVLEIGKLIEVVVVKNNLISRLWYEYYSCNIDIKKYSIDLVYTQFGPHWPGSNVRNIAGCAYSNLMYPEVDFWGGLPFHKRILKKIIDFFRKKRMLQADVIVYETEVLAERAKLQNRLPDDRVCFVKPAASSLVQKNMQHEKTRERCQALPEGYKVLLLSGYHPNKNIELLPLIASVLARAHGICDVKFIVTLPEEVYATSDILNKACELGVESSLYNFKPVPPDGCVELYRSVDAVILPARLESFSNNIAESWVMEKPLLISDLDWARSICGDGAIYFNYNDPASAALKIMSLRNSDNIRKNTVNCGSNVLKTYPTSQERFMEYLKIIERN